MATTSSVSSSEVPTNANGEFPDCIIASSSRFNDLLPFCNSLYQADPQKWGCILPWEFPQNGTKEVEETFLRQYFSEVGIHMQGGAHGVGAGFRFLKQAWYSIALWNYEQRVPSIATWWLEDADKAGVLEDAKAREDLCGPEAKPETCFGSHEIQMYGRNLLGCVVKLIQDQVKAREVQPIAEPQPRQPVEVEAAQTTDMLRSASDGNSALNKGKRQSLPVAAVSKDGRVGNSGDTRPPRATSAMGPADELATPFPIYHEKAPIRQRSLNGDAPTAEYPTPYVRGRKQRGGRLSSGGSSTRGTGYDRRPHEYQHRFNSNPFSSNNGFEYGSPAPATSIPGPAMHQSHMSAAYSNLSHPMPGAPPAPAYNPSRARTPRQQIRGPCFPSGELHPQHSMNPSMFAGGPTNPNHHLPHTDADSFASDRSVYSGFNEISSRSGDVRRSSFGSRGGGIRGSGQHRGNRRGGRGRDSVHHAVPFFEDASHARKAFNEFYPKPNSTYGKRRGSAYNENTWRSSSEHPQVENAFPQRALSGPDQYQNFHELSGVTGSNLLPPFPFSHDQAVGRQGQVKNNPSTARLAHLPHAIPDVEVDEKYIGTDAKHVQELIAFNIPRQATEDDVAKEFGSTCDVNVVSVNFDHNAVYGPDVFTKLAFIKLPNHNVARRVLDLREIQLYGQPLEVRVPRYLLSQPTMPFIAGHYGHNHTTSNDSFVPRSEFLPGAYGYPAPNSGFPAATYGPPGETVHPGFPGFQSPMPYFVNNGESALSTVLSSNATPATSEPSTPKKAFKKKNKKKIGTPRTKIVEDDSSAQADGASKQHPQETPVKTKRKKQGLQDRTASSDQLTPGEIPSSSIAASAKTPKTPKVVETAKQSQAPLKCSTNVAPQTAPGVASSVDPSQGHQENLDVTPAVSPRSQIPENVSKQGALVLDKKQSENCAAGKEPEVLQVSSPVSDKGRPSLFDRTSDSDHVDESFHTASATPPADKRSQIQKVSPGEEKRSNTAKKHANPAQIDEAIKKSSTPDSSVPLHDGKSSGPEQTPKTPKTPLSISVQEPSPSKTKSASVPKDSKASRSTSSRSVSGPSNIKQTAASIEAEADNGNLTDLSHVATDGDEKDLKQLSLEKTSLLTANHDKRSGENLAPNLSTQTVTSVGSIPPTPMTVYHTAPTTPAQISTPMSDHSAEKPSSHSKAPAKKGPSQTESFSMFGKKQKQKKPSKGKGTLKGKPLELGNASSTASGTTGQGVSGTATPELSVSTPSSNRISVKTNTGGDVPTLNTGGLKGKSKSGEVVSCDGTTTAASGPESPSKGGLRNFFGLFGSSGRTKSPSVSGKETSSEDIPPGDELMDSKASAETPLAVFNVDHLLPCPSDTHIDTGADSTARASTIFGGLGSLEDTGGMSAAGLGISTLSNFNFQEMSKKKNKKKNKKSKSAKQNADQKEDSPGVDADGAEAMSISNSSPRTGATSASYDLESDDKSDKSSTTMGRPTPPASPALLTPSKRKQIEQRKTEEHIVSPRAPRNKHVKKKSYSRLASSATATPVQETPAQEAPLPPGAAASEIEVDQQVRLMHLYHIPRNADGDEESASQGALDLSKVLLYAGLTDDDGNNSQVNLLLFRARNLINNSRRLDVDQKSSVSDAGSNDMATTMDSAIEAENGQQVTKLGATEDESTKEKE